MPICLRIMCWNIACGSGDRPEAEYQNTKLPGIAKQIRAKYPDIVLLNEVVHWNPHMHGGLNQTAALAAWTNLPHCRWAQLVQLGASGFKCVSVLSRYPLTMARVHWVMRGSMPTTFGTLETAALIDNQVHHIFSTRFDAHHEDDNVAAHGQAIKLIQNINPNEPVIFGGDFNANPEKPQMVNFLRHSGLTDVYLSKPDPIMDENLEDMVDRIFYRGSYSVGLTQIRRPWTAQEDLSDHPFVFGELSSDFVARYGSVIKVRHVYSGGTLHSHPYNYGHPGSSGQQQVTAFEGADDNDLWRVKGPHGKPEDYRIGQTVQSGDMIRLEHVSTRRNLHSHSGHPSPVTGLQEVTCFGDNGLGDENDNWRIGIVGSRKWQSGARVSFTHVSTDYSLHSVSGHSHPQWTKGQQEVAAWEYLDDNDRWYLSELRSEEHIPLIVVTEPSPLQLGRELTVTVNVSVYDEEQGAPRRVAGKVKIANNIVAATNTPFKYTFTDRRITGWVIVPGYPDTQIPIRFAELEVAIQPYPVPIGVQRNFIVRAEDSHTHAPVDGAVKINDAEVARTNVTFSYRFVMKTRRRRDPDTGTWITEIIPPVGMVSASGYPEATIDLGV